MIGFEQTETDRVIDAYNRALGKAEIQRRNVLALYSRSVVTISAISSKHNGDQASIRQSADDLSNILSAGRTKKTQERALRHYDTLIADLNRYITTYKIRSIHAEIAMTQGDARAISAGNRALATASMSVIKAHQETDDTLETIRPRIEAALERDDVQSRENDELDELDLDTILGQMPTQTRTTEQAMTAA